MCVLCWGNDVTVGGGVLSSECSPPMCVLCWGNDMTVGGVLRVQAQSAGRLCVCFAGVMM